VAILGTIDEDGRPHLVPVTFALVDHMLYTAVDHKPKSTSDLKRLRNIERDPRVTVLAEEYHDDWERLWWTRVEGEATVEASCVTGVEALASRYEQYRARAPVGPVIAIHVDRVVGWASSHRM
jgi:PPOX class probable F420-dependent enzyme